MAGIGGGVLGAGFGLFMSSMDSPSSQYLHAVDNNIKVPMRQQLREVGRDMLTKCTQTSKQFATVGLVFAASECVIEGYRAKHDIVNPVAAGCVTGAILGASGGPHAAAMGCAGFAAFSAAIDYFMESH